MSLAEKCVVCVNSKKGGINFLDGIFDFYKGGI